MKFPESSEDIKNEIIISADKYDEIADLRIRQLIKILPNVPDELIVEGVIRVFEITDRPDKQYLDQELAGKILAQVNPKSQIELNKLIKRVLANWDKSIEQLPIWFRNNYGMEAVKRIFDNIENSGILALEKEKLDTMRWWIGIKKPVPNKGTSDKPGDDELAL